MLLKTIAFTCFCLVQCVWMGCADASKVREVSQVSTEIGYAEITPLYHVVVPESIQTAVVWNQSTPLFVNEISSMEYLVVGDTVLSGSDPFFSVEMERVEMALNIASALNDSMAIDSLSALLSDSSSFIFVTSPAAGAAEYLALKSSTLQPGDTIAVLTGPPPDSVYILSPDYFHIRWPGNIPGCTATPSGLECHGSLPGETASLPGTWSLHSRFIYENDLNSFLVAASGDTIPVTIIGSTDTSKIIYTVLPLDSVALIPW